MKVIKGGRLALDGGPRGKGIFNHPYSFKERGKVERKTLDILTGRGLTLTGSMTLSSSSNKNLLSCHIRRRLQLTWFYFLSLKARMMRKMYK